ncbi:hypothetical protein BOTBODRAFT_177263 [Botryobasidium botryosum FD-172 SS1]|uniref:Uncharacterized protein n=1 Tax=Botryobasidium botryosum (strain FD-172 SS1) TaxID=930990 RepID=A0A067M9Q8_BOTB1|nr:hypothetical protein BOTBODRAFT_177263 [Botryobasidium botryosum FD-172 SS1]
MSSQSARRPRQKVPYGIAAVARAKKAASNQAYEVDILDQLVETTGKAETIAKKHRRSVKSVERHLHLGGPRLSGKRKPSAWNACLKIASEQLAGTVVRSKGNQPDIEERAQELLEDYNSDSGDPDAKELVNMRMQSMAESKTAPKVNAKAIQGDANHTLAKVGEAMANLHARTGVEYLLVYCRGDVNDQIPPGFMASAGGEKFANCFLSTDGTKMAQNLEAFTALGAKEKLGAQVANGISKASARDIIRNKLREITGDMKANVPWTNYERECDRYGVEIVGWPADIPFLNLSYISAKQVIRVKNAWIQGIARWEKTSQTSHGESHSASTSAPAPPTPAITTQWQMAAAISTAASSSTSGDPPVYNSEAATFRPLNIVQYPLRF